MVRSFQSVPPSSPSRCKLERTLWKPSPPHLQHYHPTALWSTLRRGIPVRCRSGGRSWGSCDGGVAVEAGGVCESVGWPVGLRCLGSSHTTLPLCSLVAAVLGVRSSWAQQGAEGAGYCVHVNACVSVCVRQPGEPNRCFIYTDISQRWW